MYGSKPAVCYVCYEANPETNLAHLSKIVSEMGYDVSVLTRSASPTTSVEQLDHCTIYRIGVPTLASTRRRWLSFTRGVVRILDTHPFSIVHVHSSCKYFLLFKLLSSSKAKFVHHITTSPIRPLRFHRFRSMLLTYLQSLFMDAVLVHSQELKDNYFGIKHLKRAHVIPVGFNKKVLYPISNDRRRRMRSTLGISENHQVLVYCGTISKFRRLHGLIEAFASVLTVYRHVTLVMIGDGNAADDLRLLAKSLNVCNNILFVGHVPHQEVVDFLGMADVGLSYIPVHEGYNYNPPLKTFEYLACGLACIATNTVSNCRIIINGYNGILVSDEPKNVSAGILELLFDSRKLFLLRRNSRKSILSFDFRNIARNSLLPVYASILDT